MAPQSAGARWRTLQAKAHLPEAQEVIRREIFKGTIRVVPGPGGGIRIIPMTDGEPIEEPEPFPFAVGVCDQAPRREFTLRIGRITS
jgi:hypothetical protein